MTVLGNCQTSQALALECGIFDQEELEPARLKLVETIRNNNNENACGMLGARNIFHALTKAGYADLAYDMIVSENRTGFGSWIKSGETTLCESFIEADGVVDSRNHHFFGNISSWMIQDICGLKPNPNLDDITYVEISPSFISALSYANATFKTASGELNVSWERKDNAVMIKIQIPKGIRSELKLKGRKSILLKQGENIIIE